jgi:hypothetical protein
VLHNLIFGCLLVFLIQWLFLGELRSAIIVSVNIPFALFFAIIILVLQGEDANLLSLGAVDFGIIVDSAVIMMENIYRNFQSPPDGPVLLDAGPFQLAAVPRTAGRASRARPGQEHPERGPAELVCPRSVGSRCSTIHIWTKRSSKQAKAPLTKPELKRSGSASINPAIFEGRSNLRRMLEWTQCLFIRRRY